MKIKSIAISNVLSFPYFSDFTQCPAIQFDEGLNILVGPNGAGKSNFLAIINYLFQHILFLPFSLDEGAITRFRQDADFETMQKKAITHEQGIPRQHLSSHRLSNRAESKISLELFFNQNDRQNFSFVYDNAGSINAFIAKYSKLNVAFPTNFDSQVFASLLKYDLQFFRDGGGEFRQQNPFKSGLGHPNFIWQFLQHRELLAHIIYLANNYEGLQWEPLKDTFALIGSHRNYENIATTFSLQEQGNQTVRHSSAMLRGQSPHSTGQGEPPLFDMIKRRLADIYTDLYHMAGKSAADERIKTNLIFRSINDLLAKSPLMLEMRISRPSPKTTEHEIHFVHSLTGEIQFIQQLSTGQKNMLFLIFILHGADLANGLMLIDEPELHLHIQTQEEFLNAIRNIAFQDNIQFILVSHSPAFIHAKDLQHIFRFYQDDIGTRVVNPKISAEDKQIWHIINLSNASRIFFSRGIILVEGDTDEYFYRHLLSELVDSGEAQAGIEIINIKGKGKFTVWKEFLTNYGIFSAYIGDWDNIENFEILSPTELRQITELAKIDLNPTQRQLLSKGSQDKDKIINLIDKVLEEPNPANLKSLGQFRDYMIQRHIPYNKVLHFLRGNDPKLLQRVQQDIARIKYSGIFLLPDGELEDYLDIFKGIQALLDFFKDEYPSWRKSNAEKYEQLLSILKGAVFFLSPKTIQ
jgi:putative ATP-dependent endonuclease of the OLD family